MQIWVAVMQRLRGVKGLGAFRGQGDWYLRGLRWKVGGEEAGRTRSRW